MELFKFHNPSYDTLMEQGEMINGVSDIMWIERYRDAGEFTIKAPVATGIRDQIPTGTLISHVDTTEIMIVENHEISDDSGEATFVTITGRSFETILEQRVVGASKAMPTEVIDNTLAADYTWNQVVKLIWNDITDSGHPQNVLNYVQAFTNVTGTGESVARIIRRINTYAAALELMAIDNLGIKAIRPGPESPFGPASLYTSLLIHKGVDRSADVIFSYDGGDIDTADYLWSIKSLKTSVLVTGRWLETRVDGPGSNYDRRIMEVDGSWIDSTFTTVPTGVDRTNVLNAMTIFGNQVLAAQKETAIANAKIARNVKAYLYRKDFDLGDIITVLGNYDATSKMRVIEYVEIEDANGESSYPTLATL